MTSAEQDAFWQDEERHADEQVFELPLAWQWEELSEGTE